MPAPTSDRGKSVGEGEEKGGGERGGGARKRGEGVRCSGEGEGWMKKVGENRVKRRG